MGRKNQVICLVVVASLWTGVISAETGNAKPLSDLDGPVVSLSLSQPKAEEPLNVLLRKIRSADYPVEISMQTELERIRATVNRLDPMTYEEAIKLVEHLGESYASVQQRMKQPGITRETAEDLKEEARDIFRNLLAVTIRYESITDRGERWIDAHSKIWHFVGDIVTIWAAVVGVDLAMKMGSDPAIIMLESFGLAFTSVGVFLAPVAAYFLGKRVKMIHLVAAFQRGAKMQSFLGANYATSSLFLNRLQKQLNYPKNFSKCALALRKVSH